MNFYKLLNINKSMPRKLYKILLISLFITVTLNLYSKSESQLRIDSMLLELPFAKEDSNHVNLLSLLSFEYQVSNMDQGIKYGLDGLKLAKIINFKRGEAICNLNIGRNYFAEKKFDLALSYYNKSLELYTQIGDKYAISNNLSYIANLYSTQSKYPKLLEYLDKIIKINKGMGNQAQIADEINNIGLVNLYLSKYNEALKSFNESYLINSELKDTIAMGFNIVNSGRVYKELNELDKALTNFKKGLNVFRKAKDIYNVSRIYYFISEIHFLKNDEAESMYYVDKAINEIPVESESKKYQIKEYTRSLLLKSKLLFEQQKFLEALKYSNSALTYSQKIHYSDGVAFSYSTLGKLFLNFTKDSTIKKIQKENSTFNLNKTTNLNLSIKYFLLAEEIYSSIGELEERSNNMKFLSLAYKAKGDIRKAFNYYQIYVDLKDSVFSKENIKNIGKLESDFQYKIMLSNSEKNRISALKKEAMSKSLNTILQIIVTALFLLVLLFFWLYYQRKKNIQILVEKNKLIESQRNDIESKKEQLMKMNIAKDKIFGTISHDLRNTIKGFVVGTENLSKVLPKELNTDLLFMNQSATRINGLLESLLQYADQGFHQFNIEFQKIDLSLIITETINIYSQEIISKKLKLTTDLKIPDIHTNEAYAGVIIRNIIHNAIKFTPIGGKIEITSSKEDEYVILKIKDNGIGISAEDIERVNNYQCPQILSPIGDINKGTGFGLITAKEFIEKVNGNLFIESEMGNGTTIFLYFQL